MIKNFMPKPGGSQVVAATVAAAAVTIPVGCDALNVANDGPGNAFIRIGTGDASPTTDQVLLVGVVMAFGYAPGIAVSVISASTSTLYISPGSGS